MPKWCLPPRGHPDSVLLLVLAVDSARLRCDHDVTPPISMMDWTPPPPLACSLTPIHARCDHDVTPRADLYDGLDPTPAASVLAYTDSCTNASNAT